MAFLRLPSEKRQGNSTAGVCSTEEAKGFISRVNISQWPVSSIRQTWLHSWHSIHNYAASWGLGIPCLTLTAFNPTDQSSSSCFLYADLRLSSCFQHCGDFICFSHKVYYIIFLHFIHFEDMHVAEFLGNGFMIDNDQCY